MCLDLKSGINSMGASISTSLASFPPAASWSEFRSGGQKTPVWENGTLLLLVCIHRCFSTLHSSICRDLTILICSVACWKSDFECLWLFLYGIVLLDFFLKYLCSSWSISVDVAPTSPRSYWVGFPFIFSHFVLKKLMMSLMITFHYRIYYYLFKYNFKEDLRKDSE